MHIEIPAELESELTQRAQDAGCETIREYILKLIEEDREQETWLRELATDPRLKDAIREGLQSGPAEPLDMQSIRQNVSQRLNRQDG